MLLLLLLLLLGAVRAPEPACDFAVVDDPALLQRHQQPALLRGGAEHWPALREWRGFPAFVERHPNLSLPIQRPESKLERILAPSGPGCVMRRRRVPRILCVEVDWRHWLRVFAALARWMLAALLPR